MKTIGRLFYIPLAVVVTVLNAFSVVTKDWAESISNFGLKNLELDNYYPTHSSNALQIVNWGLFLSIIWIVTK